MSSALRPSTLAAPPATLLLGSAVHGTTAALAVAVGVLAGHLITPGAAIGNPAGLGLPLGVLFALTLRWGHVAWIGGTLALLLALLALGAAPASALVTSLAGGVSVAGALQLLRARDFDRRLERPRDVLWLVLTLTMGVAPWATAAALMPTGLAPAKGALASPTPWLLSWIASSAVVSASATVVALPLLAATRGSPASVLATMRGSLALDVVLALALFGCTFASAIDGAPAWAGLLAFAAPALLLALLMRTGLVPTSTLLALMSIFVTALAHGAVAGGSLASRTAQLQLATPMLALLAVLLIAHAGRAASLWRENRWEWALDGSRMGVADWSLSGPEHFVSATWRRLTSHEDGPWSPRHWLLRVHADDRVALEQAIAAVASGADGRRQLELRMPSGDQWRWYEATLLVLERHAAGQPIRLLATVIDVDERHEAQQRQRLSASLFLHLHEGLLITDEYLRALDVNPAYTQILGVQREEVLGTVPALLRPNPPDPLARQQRVAMWNALHEQGSWRGELLERRRSGELCTLQATVTAVPGSSSDLRYHVLVISDITEQRVQRERLERQAHFDELTRLPNRTRLSELLGDAMLAADRDGYLLTVCYLDLDHFKPVNDRFGHAAGDRLLAELAGRLRSALRTRETWADVAARLGGDEFVLLLRAGTLDEARLAVERVLRVVAQPYLIDPAAEPVQVTASMGATVYPIDRSDADTLLRHADHAMYGAKQSGRNGYLFFDPEHRRRTEERVMAIGRVQEALDQSEFVLFYQPKVDMKSGQVLGLEALMRWEHPQQGLIAPLQFLPLIENTGLSARVGDWALSQALEHLSLWRRGGLDIAVSVNISARHIQEPDFALRLSELLARYPEPLAEHVELEMLETAAHADIEATSALMARCRAIGVRFALDDFGTGYSTLTYLKRLPVDTLKIDRSFVHHMLDDAQDRAIVEGVIGLARTFGCSVVAEGVESPAQARTLLELGCPIGQGIGIAAPMPASQVANWVREYRGMFSLTPAPADNAARGGAAP